LRADDVIGDDGVDEVWQRAYDRLVEEQSGVRDRAEEKHEEDAEPETEAAEDVDTNVAADRIAAIDAQLHRWPDDFQVNRKLARQLEKRSRAVPDGGSLDWAHAEALAFGSLLAD